MSRTTDPFWPFMQLRREISQLLDGYEGNGRNTGAFPLVNIWEDGDNFYAEAELPGVTQAGIEVFTLGDELTIRGRREPVEAKDGTYHRQERGMGQFERVVTLPAYVEADKVDAQLHNGVLTIRMPKAEQARPRKIAVHAG
jgi:HSP20 family protein